MLQTDLAPDRTAKDAHFTTLMENYGTDVLRMCCFLLSGKRFAGPDEGYNVGISTRSSAG